MERVEAARVLGVDVTATPREVRDAYRRLARREHPDTSGCGVDAMVELNEAHRTLRASEAPRPDPASDAPDAPDEPPEMSDGWSDAHDPSPAAQRGLRLLTIAMFVVGVVMTTVVFIAAIGYDWSVTP